MAYGERDSDQTDFGVTAYVIGCGASAGEATVALEDALAAFASAIVTAVAPAEDSSKLQ
jgi:hypothetical protein